MHPALKFRHVQTSPRRSTRGAVEALLTASLFRRVQDVDARARALARGLVDRIGVVAKNTELRAREQQKLEVSLLGWRFGARDAMSGAGAKQMVLWCAVWCAVWRERAAPGCYALPGADRVHDATSRYAAVCGTDTAYGATWYALSGTDLAYDASRRRRGSCSTSSVRWVGSAICLRASYALSSTDLAYAGTAGAPRLREILHCVDEVRCHASKTPQRMNVPTVFYMSWQKGSYVPTRDMRVCVCAWIAWV
eukprot:2119352-Rhodomonas_salina.1